MVLLRDIREQTEQTTMRSASTKFSSGFPRHDYPFDPVDLGSSGALARTAHR
jgi:hypothetical protein